MKSVSEVLLQRRSIRRYERESIPEETMQMLFATHRQVTMVSNSR